MLLNEFLKEHRKVEEQGATIARQEKEFDSKLSQQQKTFNSRLAQQQKEIQVLTASLKEQASQIQEVPDEVKLNKPAARLVDNQLKLKLTTDSADDTNGL